MQDGSFEMRFCTDAGRLVPQIDPVADMGTFVYAVYQMSSWCGKEYMAEGTTCTWPEWIAAWSKATGTPAKFCEVPREVMVKACGDEDFGGEIADMYDYASNPGYDGGKTLLRAEDLRKVSGPNVERQQKEGQWLTHPKAGVDCPMTGLQDCMMKQDWSSVLAKSVVTSE